MRDTGTHKRGPYTDFTGFVSDDYLNDDAALVTIEMTETGTVRQATAILSPHSCEIPSLSASDETPVVIWPSECKRRRELSQRERMLLRCVVGFVVGVYIGLVHVAALLYLVN